jgi:2'-5' RNA ligase
MAGDMRTFMALRLPEAALAGASEVSAALRDQLGDRDVRWVAPENLHVTLRFFGDLDDRDLARARAVVGGLDRGFPALPTAWERLGAFPSPSRVQVVWLGLRDPDGRIAGLAADVDRRIRDAGLGRADKPFKSHVTLGRVRRERRVSFDRMSERLTIPSTGFSIATIVLMKSTLTPQGPVYTPLETAAAHTQDPLQGGGPGGKEFHHGGHGQGS